MAASRLNAYFQNPDHHLRVDVLFLLVGIFVLGQNQLDRAAEPHRPTLHGQDHDQAPLRQDACDAYWGLMIAPAFLVGLAFAPDGVRDLLARARDRRRITVTRLVR